MDFWLQPSNTVVRATLSAESDFEKILKYRLKFCYVMRLKHKDVTRSQTHLRQHSRQHVIACTPYSPCVHTASDDVLA